MKFVSKLVSLNYTDKVLKRWRHKYPHRDYYFLSKIHKDERNVAATNAKN